jgi:hypothetical protein
VSRRELMLAMRQVMEPWRRGGSHVGASIPAREKRTGARRNYRRLRKVRRKWDNQVKVRAVSQSEQPSLSHESRKEKPSPPGSSRLGSQRQFHFRIASKLWPEFGGPLVRLQRKKDVIVCEYEGGFAELPGAFRTQIEQLRNPRSW